MSSTTHLIPTEQAPRSVARNKRMQARITEMFKRIQVEVEVPNEEMSTFQDEQRHKGSWGQDKDGIYFQHADGRKQYKHL